MRVDAHHHLWRYDPVEYGWIDDRMKKLQRDFLLPELTRETSEAGVHATIVVQARQTIIETKWLLQEAGSAGIIEGVVGWVPLSDPHIPSTLDELCANPLLKGLRHVVQSEPEGFLDDVSFNNGIAAMQGRELVYDLLIVARQLPETVRFIDRHPQQIFVVDHLAKPDIRGNGFASWNTAIRELARRKNVYCKLSGMVTEAVWNDWTPALLKPYTETVLEAFGPSRLMVGSDWPVLTLACDYRRWWQTISKWLDELSSAERALIEGEVAAHIYRVTSPTTATPNLAAETDTEMS